LRIPILIIIGVLNLGRTFFITFSYCSFKSEASFSFFWESLKAYYFEKEANDLIVPTPPQVILGDQVGGLISLVPKAFPEAKLQSCD